MRIETHVHTRYSKDSVQCFWPLYLKCRSKKIDVIAITEHNNIEGGQAFQKFCCKRGSKLQVIVGEEIFTDSGEAEAVKRTIPQSPDLRSTPSGLPVSASIDFPKNRYDQVLPPSPPL